MAGNQVNSKSTTSPLSITTLTQLVTSVSISPNAAQTKNIGETFTITPTVGPSNANNKNVNWTSSNTTVATVSKASTASGTTVTVACKTAGTTTITATAADGSGKSANLSLTVIDPLTSLTLDKTQTTLLYGGATTTVTVNITPSDYDVNNLTWTIGDTSLATISGSGKTRTITSNNTKKTGETTLTVSGGDKTATMEINIVNFTTTTYSYTGSVQSVTLPAGTYKLEVWGAEGGDDGGTGTNGTPGKGGYSVGNISLKSNIIAYIYVGGKGINGIQGHSEKSGGFNGGGKSGNDNKESVQGQGGSGGGGTDIRLANNSLYARVIVAGGGGGAANDEGNRSSVNGGYGGGISGQTVYLTNYAYGGTQTAGGNTTGKDTGFPNSESATAGQFGIGGNGGGGVCGAGGGGGGGWYGGGGGVGAFESGGGGGSGYVYTSSTASNYPSGCLLNSSYYLTNAQTIAGNQSFPSPTSSSNETGHSGNGYARITPVN